MRSLAAAELIENFDEKLSIIKSWHDDYHRGSLLRDNETSREQAFNQQIFGRILGYSEKPLSPFTFEAKSSTATGQMPDARIGFFDLSRDLDKTAAVIELKGASISLDKPQKGHANQSPVQQGFKYRPQYRGCDFVIVSNFYETRLYNDNLLDFEVWTLDDLVDPTDDYINFRVFHFLLCSKNFTSETGKSRTQQLLLETRTNQESMGRRFYADYKEARTTLISDLWERNEIVRENPELGIEKAQKVIDRVVFACFAEDSGFIPDATLARVIKEASDSAFGTAWGTLRNFFDAIDRGSDKLGIPVGFNGGLFSKDTDLDQLSIGDEALQKILKLGNYNFADDLSVTILGHIFEQSISDLEEIRDEARKNRDLSVGRLSKRKKDGIFYTPDHVVRAIIDQSLGAYLRGIERDCLEAAGLNDALSDQNFEKRQITAYLNYQKRLQEVKVVDPACGSGAFLVAAFDYLMAENKRVHEILGPNLLGADDIIKPILTSNLFGVDLNDESVEITKLSLWLKTATKGEKLTKLDDNILVGNSLLDDEQISPDRNFNWEQKFQDIISAGGFDVVVGNPPYVDSELMVKTNLEERNYIAKNYETAQGNWDLFVPFYQKAFDLLRDGGICSMIIPNKVLVANYASKLRSYLLSRGALIGVTDLSAKGVFEVDVYPVIVTTQKGVQQDRVMVQSDLNSIPVEREISKDLANWGLLLSDSNLDFSSGSTKRLDEVFNIFPAATVAEAYQLKESIQESMHATTGRVVNSGTIDPYFNDWGLWPMTYIKGRYLYPVAPQELLTNSKKLWLGRNKVIVAGMSQTIEACHSVGDTLFPGKSTVVVTAMNDSNLTSYAALALLNSKPFRTRFTAINQLNAMAGGYMTVSRNNLGEAPVPVTISKAAIKLNELGEEADQAALGLIRTSAELKKLLQSEFGEEAWTPKLKGWWDSDFAQFVKKMGLSLTMTQKNELIPIHERYQQQAVTFSVTLKEIEGQIDELIESLYSQSM